MSEITPALPRGITKAGTVTVHPDGRRHVHGFHFDGVDLGTGGDLALTWAASWLLHGRITWEMVDALREGAVYLRKAADGEGDVYRRQDRDEWWNPVGEPGPSGTDLADATDLVADLLESLLPPRKP